MANTKPDMGGESGWVGWVFFAGFLMTLAGIFQSIMGLVAILKNTLYVLSPNNLVAFDYTTWGWIHLLLGVVLLMSAGSLLQGRAWGRFVGMLLVTLSAVANLTFVSAYPLWCITVIVVDVLVLYAIAVHGDEASA